MVRPYEPQKQVTQAIAVDYSNRAPTACHAPAGVLGQGAVMRYFCLAACCYA